MHISIKHKYLDWYDCKASNYVGRLASLLQYLNLDPQQDVENEKCNSRTVATITAHEQNPSNEAVLET